MEKRKYQMSLEDEKGSIIPLVVIFLLCMTLLAAASATLARTQWVMARFSRQTSNSYHLARSGAEKVIDSMNKEIAKELPRMMKQASNAAQMEMLTGDHGLSYQPDTLEETKGKYVGRTYENLYEVKLKELMYDHIVTKFLSSMEYEALSDVKENQPIKIKTNIYHRGSAGVPADLVSAINQLVSSAEVGNSKKSSFLVEVVAWAEKDTRTSLTKSRVIGEIALSQLITNDEELLEEYAWGDVAPEALQSAIISFGDFVIQGDYSATIDGDIHVKGTQRKATMSEYISKDFPEPDQSGGIVVSEGGILNVLGNAFAVANIQTANSYRKETMGATIHITNDAVASTIAINDNYYLGHGENLEPWDYPVQNNRIFIGRNAYTDNDVRIDRYVEGGTIEVAESVFGISDKDLDGQLVDGIIIVDPNKSSGIFCLGEDSQIKMRRAFVAGQPFINFDDGMGYHRLHESMGEPFEDVYYLEEYRQENNDSDQYIRDFYEMINREKIVIDEQINLKPYGFAPALASATISGSSGGDSYDIKEGNTPMANQSMARAMFYEGLMSFPSNWELGLSANSDWGDHIPGQTTDNWASVIENPYDYFNGNNPYNKRFIPGEPYADGSTFEYDNMLGYKGLQGYMLAKRGVFYGEFKPTNSLTKYEPRERFFDDLIDISVFTETHKWSNNNPIYVVTGSETIDISQFKEVPTAIVCTDAGATLTLETGGGTNVLNGVIISAGKINIASEMTINGVIIAGNESTSVPSREEIQQGMAAGVQISANNVTVVHDRNQLLAIRCMDKSLQRNLYDCLKITQYKDANSVAPGDEDARIDVIMGPAGKRRIKLSPLSVIHSKQGGVQFVLKSLRKL